MSTQWIEHEQQVSCCKRKTDGCIIYWLIMTGLDYVSELRPPSSLVHPPVDMWAWRPMVMIMPAADSSWLVHKSSLAVLPAYISEASRRNGRKSDNFSYQYLKYLKGSLTCRKILRHGTSGFTSHPKEGVLRIFIAVINPWPRSGLNRRPLDPVASTVTTTPPRRLLLYRTSEDILNTS
jgi:hypothetical protein